MSCPEERHGIVSPLLFASDSPTNRRARVADSDAGVPSLHALENLEMFAKTKASHVLGLLFYRGKHSSK